MVTRNVTFAEGEYYHLYDRGVDKRVVFVDEADRVRFIRLLYATNSDKLIRLDEFQGEPLQKIIKGQPIVAIGSWCIMPNHFHILAKEIVEGGISKFMLKLLTGYSMYFNTKYFRKGTLFDRPYKAKHLDSDKYLKYQYAYIHLNPIGIIDKGWKEKYISDRNRAKKFLDEYKYSSGMDYRGVKRDEGMILDIDAFPKYFDTSTDFKAMIKEWMSHSELYS